MYSNTSICIIPLATSKNEKYFYDYYNEFEYNHDLVVIVFNVFF